MTDSASRRARSSSAEVLLALASREAERALAPLGAARSARQPSLVVCEAARTGELRRRHPRALLLAVLDAGADAARALDDGADGVVRCGAPAELLARAHALLRRATPVVELSARERALLACLASEPGRVFTKAELRAAVWGAQPPPADGRALEALVTRLRRRLGPHGPALVTVWSVGYRLGLRR